MSYIQGFLVPVPKANRDAYHDMVVKFAPIAMEFGALRIVETWGDDLPRGQVTDFFRAVAATEPETVVFAWIEWPDKATCDASAQRMQSDERMQAFGDMPFDGKRMIWGGFAPLFDSGA